MRGSRDGGASRPDALLDRKPAQLSGGQQQRVALGRAIIARRRSASWTSRCRISTRSCAPRCGARLRALQQRLGMTMLYVTHDQVEAMTMADQVMLMNAGRIEQDAPPAELYERPASVFAARFVGTPPMNVLPARARAAERLWAHRTLRLTRRPGRDRIRCCDRRRPENPPRETRCAGDRRGGRISRRRHADRGESRGRINSWRASAAAPAAPATRRASGLGRGSAHWFDMSTGTSHR
jgi:ABC-type Fe3+/spermidine/putrescine transport system ATPase subunit